MANIKYAYGANTPITVTLASLAAAAARQSTAIDNSANLWIDALVILRIRTGASAPTGQKAVNVYLYASNDGGTTYTEGASGVDGAITLVSPTNLIRLGQVSAPSAATVYIGGPWSVSSIMGGVLPDHWGIVVENQTGQIFDATETNFTKSYTGVYATSV